MFTRIGIIGSGAIGSLVGGMLTRAGRDFTRKSFISAMETLQNFATEGLSAPFNYGLGDHHGPTASRLYGYDFKEQRITPRTDWIKH